MKKFSYILIAVIFFAIGFLLATLWIGTKKEAVGFTEESFNEMGTDSLRKVQQVADSVLHVKEKALFDSLRDVARVRDSVILVKGKLTSTQLAFPRGSADYKSMDSLSLSLDSLIYLADEVLMSRITDLLKPSNQAFKSLIKSIKDKKERLEKIAGKYSTVADVVSVLINILSSPILAPAAAADVSFVVPVDKVSDV